MTRSRAEVLFVLLTLQAALALLGAVGLLLFMGSALYLAGSVLKGAVLFVLATKIVGGREWALVLAIAVEWVALLAVWAGVLLGLLPMFTPSMTMTGLLTEIGLPVAVMWLCATQLASTRRSWPAHRPVRQLPPTAPFPAPWASR